MFCFETAMKMFHWSMLVYGFQEVSGAPLQTHQTNEARCRGPAVARACRARSAKGRG
jgi:hypothetical protein